MKFTLLLVGLVTASAQFQVDVHLVRLLVNVKNPDGDLVGSLDRKEFTVFDNGVPQQIAVFERYTTRPLKVSLLVDISASTAKDLHYEETSVGKFLHALFDEGNPDDRAALFSFNYDVTLLSDFTRRQQLLEDRLRSVRPDSGTSLYDAICLASEHMQRQEGRHVMVIVSDGGNTTSTRKFKDALDAVQHADTVLYPIVVVPITNDAGRNLGGEHALQTLASETGGRWFYPSVGDELDQAFSDILRDLRAQYMLGYYPRGLPPRIKNDAPAFHLVRVDLKRKDLRAFTRTGYYGEDSR